MHGNTRCEQALEPHVLFLLACWYVFQWKTTLKLFHLTAWFIVICRRVTGMYFSIPVTMYMIMCKLHVTWVILTEILKTLWWFWAVNAEQERNWLTFKTNIEAALWFWILMMYVAIEKIYIFIYTDTSNVNRHHHFGDENLFLETSF